MEPTGARVTSLNRQFGGAVFDIDGTLLDTLSDIANAANAVLRQHGFPPHPVSTYRDFVGEGVAVLLTRALPADRRDPETVRACLQTMQVEYPRHLNETAQPYPGIPELISELRRRGLRLGILSNKPDAFAIRCIADFFPENAFAPVFGLGPDRPRKPDPAGALEIARRWGLAPGCILYLGDSGTDMQTAVAAGMFPAGVLWGYRDQAELVGAGAKVLLNTPAQLSALLGI